MLEAINQLSIKLVNSPKQLFLVDGIGAIISAISLGLILPFLQPIIGMPTIVLYSLSLTASLFALYSLGCYMFINSEYKTFITIIAIANIAYCIISIGLIINYYEILTTLGLLYFTIEKLIVAYIVYIEILVILKL